MVQLASCSSFSCSSASCGLPAHPAAAAARAGAARPGRRARGGRRGRDRGRHLRPHRHARSTTSARRSRWRPASSSTFVRGAISQQAGDCPRPTGRRPASELDDGASGCDGGSRSRCSSSSSSRSGRSAATLVAGNTPQLGLDLQGGAVGGAPARRRKVDDGVLDQAIAIIRSRVDALGVAEPDISRQGNTIVVQLPGVKNQRPGPRARRPDRRAAVPAGPRTAALRSTRPPPPTTTTTTAGRPRPTPTAATTATTTTTTTTTGTTPRGRTRREATVVLPGSTRTRTSRATSSARAELDRPGRQHGARRVRPRTPASGRSSVDLDQRGHASSSPSVLARASTSTSRSPSCSTASSQSAPTDPVGRTSTARARSRGDVHRARGQGPGPRAALRLLPVQLEPQTRADGVGHPRQGLAAGRPRRRRSSASAWCCSTCPLLPGPRPRGAARPGVSGDADVLARRRCLGETSGLALTLAGATGIIVSVGVTVDSYVVYFERLKDEIRSGKTHPLVGRPRLQPGLPHDPRRRPGVAHRRRPPLLPHRRLGARLRLLPRALDVLDLFVAYFFTRPMVVLLGRNRFFTEARFFGVARGLAAPRPEVGVSTAEMRRAKTRHLAPALPRRDVVRLRRPRQASGSLSRPSSSSSACCRSCTAGPQPRHRLRGRHGVGGAGARRLGGRGARRAAAARARRRQDPDRSARRQRVRVQADTRARGRGRAGQVQRRSPARLAEAEGVEPDVSVNDVGPVVGQARSPRRRCGALVVFFVAITIYISLRFEWKMAVAALAAVVHDILVTVGVYSLVGLRGDAGHGGRLPHDPRLLALRHHRRVRQGRGEHQAAWPRPGA